MRLIFKYFFMCFIYKYFYSLLGLCFFKGITTTYKVKIIDLEKKKLIFKDKLFIYASWHQRFFSAINHLSKRNVIAIVSQSKDGEFVSRILNMLGWNCVRGSSSKGGAKAMTNVIALTLSGKFVIGHAVDGPRGPFGIVKSGVIRMAQLTQMRIIPVIVSCNKCWFVNSWDSFIIPKPFAKIILYLDKSYNVPRLINRYEFEKKRIYLEKKMFIFQKNLDFILEPSKKNLIIKDCSNL